MRALSLALTLITCAAAAPGGVSATPAPTPPDLDVLWENTYEYDLFYSVIQSQEGVVTLDDFTLEEPAVIKGFECWFATEDDVPQPFNAALRYDDGGLPGDGFWTTRITDVTAIDTGDVFHDLFNDYGIYYFQLLLSEEDYVTVAAGRPFWLKLQWTGFPGYWTCSEGGNAYCNGTILDRSTFFTILGTPSGENVEAASWGEIKVGYSD